MINRESDRIKNGVELLLGTSVLLYLRFGGIENQFVTGNVPDLIYPITNYATGRLLFFKKPNLLLALGIASMGTIAEIGQHFGLYHDTFDLKDIPMYFIGAGIAYGFDRITFNNKTGLEDRL